MKLSLLSENEILEVIEPMMDNLMRGSREIDHAMHTRDFTPRAKAIVTPEHFERVCREYQQRIGFFTQRRLVQIFRRAHSVAVVWQQFASQSNDEFVAEIVAVELDSKVLIDHAMIF